MKPLPPFGRQVTRIFNDAANLKNYSGHNRDCTRGTVWIATGLEAWDWHNSHPLHLSVVLPPGDGPDTYYWGFLHGHEPPLILPPLADDRDASAVIAAAMLRDGITSVLAVGNSNTMRYVSDKAA